MTESSLAPFMLSPLEYGVLDRCYKEEASTVTELARVLPVDAAAMSRHVSKLEDKRLISRERLVSDRRTVRLNLTQEGRTLALRLAERMKTSQALLLHGISEDERAAFTMTARKILANLEDQPAPSSAQDGGVDAAGPSVFPYPASDVKGMKNGKTSAMCV